MSVRRVLFMTHAVSDVKGAMALYLRMFDVAEGFRARLEPHGRESTMLRIGEFYVEVTEARPLGGTIGEYAESQQFRLAGLTLSLLHPKRGDQVLTAVLARHGSSIHSFCLVVDDMESARRELLTRGVAVLRERVPRLTIHPRSAYGARILLSAPEG